MASERKQSDQDRPRPPFSLPKPEREGQESPPLRPYRPLPSPSPRPSKPAWDSSHSDIATQSTITTQDEHANNAWQKNKPHKSIKPHKKLPIRDWIGYFATLLSIDTSLIVLILVRSLQNLEDRAVSKELDAKSLTLEIDSVSGIAVPYLLPGPVRSPLSIPPMLISDLVELSGEDEGDLPEVPLMGSEHYISQYLGVDHNNPPSPGDVTDIRSDRAQLPSSEIRAVISPNGNRDNKALDNARPDTAAPSEPSIPVTPTPTNTPDPTDIPGPTANQVTEPSAPASEGTPVSPPTSEVSVDVLPVDDTVVPVESPLPLCDVSCTPDDPVDNPDALLPVDAGALIGPYWVPVRSLDLAPVEQPEPTGAEQELEIPEIEIVLENDSDIPSPADPIDSSPEPTSPEPTLDPHNPSLTEPLDEDQVNPSDEPDTTNSDIDVIVDAQPFELVIDASGGEEVITVRAGKPGVIIVENFTGVGIGAMPDPTILDEIDILQFEDFESSDLLLEQQENDLYLTSISHPETVVILKDFDMENIDNLQYIPEGWTTPVGNLLFAQDDAIEDSVDVFDADATWNRLFNPGVTTFLNDLENVVTASSSPDVVHGLGGNDQLFGGDGDDQLFGGDGDDQLFGGDGDDQLFGGDDDDQLFGGDGDDQLFGGAGDDTLTGGQGDDILSGNQGSNILVGGEGADTFTVTDSSSGIDTFSDFVVNEDRIALDQNLTWEALKIEIVTSTQGIVSTHLSLNDETNRLLTIIPNVSLDFEIASESNANNSL